jgi:hypothetical protein
LSGLLILAALGACVDFDQRVFPVTSQDEDQEEPMIASDTRKLLAAVYDDGIAADHMLSELGYALREQRVAVKGLVQRNSFRRDRAKCDMELEELGSGTIFQLSKDRGKHAGGCRLDREAIACAAALIGPALHERCDLLILNKFGRSEAEGTGLREVIAAAAEREIPTLVGVPRRNLEVWQKFAEGLFDRCNADNVSFLRTWIRDRAGCEVGPGSFASLGYREAKASAVPALS